MTCREARNRIDAYVDDELGVEGALAVEEHLERCPACRELCLRQRDLSRAIGALYPRRQAPDELRAGVLAPVRRPARARLPRALAAVAAAAVLVAAGVWALRAERPAAVPAEVTAAARVHEAAARGDVTLDLASSSLPDVNRWLERELPFFADIPAAAPGAFRLAGASAVRLGADRAGYVLYRRGEEPVSLFVLAPRRWPAVGREIRHRGIEFRAIEIGDHRVIAWSHPPVSYLLVSPRAGEPAEACAVCHASREAPAIAGFATAEGS